MDRKRLSRKKAAFEFGRPEGGPHRWQLLFVDGPDCNAGSLGVRRSRVKEIKDLKGNRVGFVVGSPALTQNSLCGARLRRLTQSASRSSNRRLTARVEGLITRHRCRFPHHHHGAGEGGGNSSPPDCYGRHFPPRTRPAGSASEGRLVLLPASATFGAGIRPENRSILATIPTRSVVTYASQSDRPAIRSPSDDRVTTTPTRVSAPGAGGLAADRQTKTWVVPVILGAVKALKEPVSVS